GAGDAALASQGWARYGALCCFVVMPRPQGSAAMPHERSSRCTSRRIATSSATNRAAPAVAPWTTRSTLAARDDPSQGSPGRWVTSPENDEGVPADRRKPDAYEG